MINKRMIRYEIIIKVYILLNSSAKTENTRYQDHRVERVLTTIHTTTNVEENQEVQNMREKDIVIIEVTVKTKNKWLFVLSTNNCWFGCFNFFDITTFIRYLNFVDRCASNNEFHMFIKNKETIRSFAKFYYQQVMFCLRHDNDWQILSFNSTIKRFIF